MPEYVRVTDEVKPRREYSVVKSAFDPEIHTEVKGDATTTDGSPLPPKYTPESLSNKSGQKAESKKEND